MSKRWQKIGCLALVIISIVPLIQLRKWARAAGQAQQCAHQMRSIGCTLHLYADDHDGHLPMTWNDMVGYIDDPRIFRCPADSNRRIAANMGSVTPDCCSYEIVAPGVNSAGTKTVYFRCKVHGFLLYSDITFFDGNERRDP